MHKLPRKGATAIHELCWEDILKLREGDITQVLQKVNNAASAARRACVGNSDLLSSAAQVRLELSERGTSFAHESCGNLWETRVLMEANQQHERSLTGI